MDSPITNRFETISNARIIEPFRKFLYLPQPERDWMYSHHGFITHFNGQYFACWSNGMVNEDDVGQRVLHATSKDGIHWSDATPLVNSEMGIYNQKVLTPGGFYTHQDRLMLYVFEYEYRPESVRNGARTDYEDKHHLNTRMWSMSSRNGVNWDERIDTGLQIGNNHPPQPTHSGRLIMPASFVYAYTDDPFGQTGWQPSGLYPADTPEHEIVDDSETIWKHWKEQCYDSIVCEGAFFQTNDDIIHMMLRSNTGYLKVSESNDDGLTWSRPCWTKFTDNGSKFHFGVLPDGRYYYVGNADPAPLMQRSRLIISLSKDGVSFDKHFIIADKPYLKRQEGINKGGNYGYPGTLIYDDKLHIIVSRYKETIEYICVDLSEFK